MERVTSVVHMVRGVLPASGLAQDWTQDIAITRTEHSRGVKWKHFFFSARQIIEKEEQEERHPGNILVLRSSHGMMTWRVSTR